MTALLDAIRYVIAFYRRLAVFGAGFLVGCAYVGFLAGIGRLTP